MDIHRQLLPPGCSPNMSSPNSGCGSRMHGISGGPRCTLQRTKDVSNELKPDGLKQANKVSPDKPTCTSVKRGATLLRSLTDQRSDGPPAWSLCLPFMTTALAKVAECKNATLMGTNRITGKVLQVCVELGGETNSEISQIDTSLTAVETGNQPTHNPKPWTNLRLDFRSRAETERYAGECLSPIPWVSAERAEEETIPVQAERKVSSRRNDNDVKIDMNGSIAPSKMLQKKKAECRQSIGLSEVHPRSNVVEDFNSVIPVRSLPNPALSASAQVVERPSSPVAQTKSPPDFVDVKQSICPSKQTDQDLSVEITNPTQFVSLKLEQTEHQSSAPVPPLERQESKQEVQSDLQQSGQGAIEEETASAPDARTVSQESEQSMEKPPEEETQLDQESPVPVLHTSQEAVEPPLPMSEEPSDRPADTPTEKDVTSLLTESNVLPEPKTAAEKAAQAAASVGKDAVPIAVGEGHASDGCEIETEQFKGTEDGATISAAEIVETKELLRMWNKLAVSIKNVNRLYYKFTAAFSAGVVKTRAYCVVFHDGEDVDYVSLLSGHRTAMQKPEVDPKFPKSRIAVTFNQTIVLAFDASCPLLRIAVILVMAHKNRKGEGEFMRRLAGVTKPLNVERFRNRMKKLEAWPLYVPQDVLGQKVAKTPTLVGALYFTLLGFSGSDGPPIEPDKVLSRTYDFSYGHLPQTVAAAMARTPVRRWYDYLNPFAAADEKEAEKIMHMGDSMAAIPLPQQHKSSYVKLQAPLKRRQITSKDSKPAIQLNNIKTLELPPKTEYDKGSLAPPLRNQRPKQTETRQRLGNMQKSGVLASGPQNTSPRSGGGAKIQRLHTSAEYCKQSKSQAANKFGNQDPAARTTVGGKEQAATSADSRGAHITTKSPYGAPTSTGKLRLQQPKGAKASVSFKSAGHAEVTTN